MLSNTTGDGSGGYGGPVTVPYSDVAKIAPEKQLGRFEVSLSFAYSLSISLVPCTPLIEVFNGGLETSSNYFQKS